MPVRMTHGYHLACPIGASLDPAYHASGVDSLVIAVLAGLALPCGTIDLVNTAYGPGHEAAPDRLTARWTI